MKMIFDEDSLPCVSRICAATVKLKLRAERSELFYFMMTTVQRVTKLAIE